MRRSTALALPNGPPPSSFRCNGSSREFSVVFASADNHANPPASVAAAPSTTSSGAKSIPIASSRCPASTSSAVSSHSKKSLTLPAATTTTHPSAVTASGATTAAASVDYYTSRFGAREAVLNTSKRTEKNKDERANTFARGIFQSLRSPATIATPTSASPATFNKEHSGTFAAHRYDSTFASLRRGSAVTGAGAERQWSARWLSRSRYAYSTWSVFAISLKSVSLESWWMRNFVFEKIPPGPSAAHAHVPGLATRTTPHCTFSEHDPAPAPHRILSSKRTWDR